MLNKPLAFVGLAGLAILAGCGGSKEEPPTDASKDGKSYVATYSQTPSSAGTTTEAPKETTTETPKDAAPADAKPAEAGKEVTTPSGLKYVDVKVGTGQSPQVGQMVSVHYTGTLENGKKFDSSHDHPGGAPFEFPIGVGKVIKGWDEGVMTMKVGGHRKLTIPADLGYGPQAMGEDIPANSTLLFDVELLGVK